MDYIIFNFSGLITQGKKHRDDILCYLLSHIQSMNDHRSQARLLHMLAMVDDAQKMKSLYGIFEKLVSSLDESCGKSTLDLINALLACFTPSSVKSLFSSKTGRYLKSFCKLLKPGNSPVKVIVASYAIDQIRESWYNVLDAQAQGAILSALLDVMSLSNSDLSLLVKRKLNDLPLTAEILAGKLATITSTFSDVESTKRVKTDEQKNDFETTSILANILELVQYNPNIAFAHRLISPLLEVLNCILNLSGDQVSPAFEFCKQLILADIHQLFEAMTEETFASFTEESVRVDLIVQCIRVTSNPQTHNAALLLLAAIGKRYPDLVLVNVMPIFTFMGSNVLRQDDNYSFHVVKQTLETIIPNLLAKSDDDEQVFSIIRVFVNAVSHVPTHRRLKLFTVLASILEKERYISSLISLLVTTSIRLPKMSLVGDQIDYPRFGMTILQEFGVSVQLSVLLNMLRQADELLDEGESIFTGMERSPKTGKKIQIRCYKFVLSILQSKRNVGQVGEDNNDIIVSLVEELLSQIDKFSGPVDDDVQETSSYQKTVVALLFDSLHCANVILSLPTFLHVIIGLIDSSDVHVTFD